MKKICKKHIKKIVCEQCKAVRYCSLICKQANWSTHQKVCKPKNSHVKNVAAFLG